MTKGFEKESKFKLANNKKKFSKTDSDLAGTGDFNRRPASGKRDFQKRSSGGKRDFQKRPGTGKQDGDIKFVKGDKRRTVVDENTKSMRRMYNRLMQKSKDQKKEINKVDIVKKIMKIVNGNYSDLCFKHDGCRVLQGSIKYGDKAQKSEIIKNLISHVYDLVVKKYSIYLAVKMFKFAEQGQKEEIINKSVYPNFGKLMKTTNGQAFLNFVFTNSSHSIQNGLVSYYMIKYLKVSEEQMKNMNENVIKEGTLAHDPANDIIINEKQGTYAGETIKDNIKLHLEKQLERNVHKNFIFQAFLNKTFDYFDTKTKVYISELFDDDLNEFVQNKYGVELACKVFTVASAKTRKKIIKKIKDNIKSFTSNETSVLFLIKVILFNDDTKLVEKYVLKSVLEQMNEELMQNKIVFKILCNIITPFNPRVNNPYENKILTYKIDSGSKKDDSKRHEELISLTMDEIFRAVNPNVKFFLTDRAYSTLLIDIIHLLIKNEDDDKLNELLKNIHAVVQIDYQNNFDELDSTLLSEKTSHFVLNKIMKAVGVNISKDYVLDFFQKISNVLLNNIEGYLSSKAVFVILNIMENAASKKFLEAGVKKYKTLIKAKAEEKGMIGFQILHKILNQ